MKEKKEVAAYSTDLIGINELLKKGWLPVQLDNKGFASISVNLLASENSEEIPWSVIALCRIGQKILDIKLLSIQLVPFYLPR